MYVGQKKIREDLKAKTEALIAVETLFAAVMVAYVFVHFMKFFFGTPKAAKAPKTRPEVPAALTVEVTE